MYPRLAFQIAHVPGSRGPLLTETKRRSFPTSKYFFSEAGLFDKKYLLPLSFKLHPLEEGIRIHIRSGIQYLADPILILIFKNKIFKEN